jgi:hypothetical protein
LVVCVREDLQLAHMDQGIFNLLSVSRNARDVHSTRSAASLLPTGASGGVIAIAGLTLALLAGKL